MRSAIAGSDPAAPAPRYALVMIQELADQDYHFDPADPRAPSMEQWNRMTLAERARVVAMLPSEVPLELVPPEGDPHWAAKVDARRTLEAFFHRIGRKIYLSSELAVFYPSEPTFAPDVLAVAEVDPHPRTKWVVADEGKGLDLVIEVHFAGHASKDYVANVERYARLGIREYFVFDCKRLRLHGHRLPDARARTYQPLVPQKAMFASEVLGLELAIDGSKLRFLYGGAAVPEAEEMIDRLESMLATVTAHREDAERLAQAEADRASMLELRLTEMERKLAEAQAEIERLKHRG